jgi:hypothetical protein
LILFLLFSFWHTAAHTHYIILYFSKFIQKKKRKMKEKKARKKKKRKSEESENDMGR